VATMHSKADAAYDEALQRICKRERKTTLDLRGLDLAALPPEIGRLTNLRAFLLQGNQLTTLPEEIGQLTDLRTLDLARNQLTTLPKNLGQLNALTTLGLGSNRLAALPKLIGEFATLTKLFLDRNLLTTLPPEIGELTTLTTLALGNNHLTTLPPEIGQLAKLTRLEVQENRLTTLPKEIGQLTALTRLYVNDNKLTTLPKEIGQLAKLTTLHLYKNRLTTLPDSLRSLTNLERLFLHENPRLRLSPTVLGPHPRESRDEGFTSAKSILDFYFGRQTGKTRLLNEVKLVLVGRGGAGKTCTVRALRGEPFREGEESTPGISLCDWMMDGCNGQPVTAHVWDFAGQVITHALHQFFFSVRSVYVVVLTGRENSERQDAEYWLRLIKAFGTDEQGEGPPVIVALNKWDLPSCRPRVDRGALQERYPFIRGFVEMDCKSNLGVAILKAALCAEVDRLQWVREPFPETWDAVRLALTKGDDTRAHLTYQPVEKGLLTGMVQ